MPVERIKMLVDGAGGGQFEFDLLYVELFGQGCLSYLQYVRTGTAGEDSCVAKTYWKLLDVSRGKLTGLLAERDIDAILRAPSSRNLNRPYFDAILSVYGSAVNLSGLVSKGKISSADEKSTFSMLASDFNIAREPPALGESPTIAIVDDVFSTGKTAGALMSVLSPHVPHGTSYVVACALRIPLSVQKQAELGIKHVFLANG